MRAISEIGESVPNPPLNSGLSFLFISEANVELTTIFWVVFFDCVAFLGDVYSCIDEVTNQNVRGPLWGSREIASLVLTSFSRIKETSQEATSVFESHNSRNESIC